MTSMILDPGAFSPASMQGYINLADGRRLSYTEWGHPAGKAVLEFRGLPSSRSGDAIDLDVLARARVRRITVDRPGLGLSDPQPGRNVLDWPTDVRGLADALGLETFAVLGTSGGHRTPPHAVMRYLSGSAVWCWSAGWGRLIGPARWTE